MAGHYEENPDTFRPGGSEDDLDPDYEGFGANDSEEEEPSDEQEEETFRDLFNEKEEPIPGLSAKKKLGW